MGKNNVFSFEHRIDEMFDVLYPVAPPGKAFHPSGRAYKPILESALGSMVCGGSNRRQLQQNREYFKVDFQDFLDFATCDLAPADMSLVSFPANTAIFYNSLTSGANSRPVHASWTADSGGKLGLSLLDAVIARDQVFVSVMMRFAGLNIAEGSEGRKVGEIIRTEDGEISECGATIIFAPESYRRSDEDAGALTEWERAMWWPAEPHDPEWRFCNSGEYTSFLLEEMEKDTNAPLSQEALAHLRDQYGSNYSRYGVFFEVARLGLKLPNYVDFMYDLVVTEKRKVGVKSRIKRTGKNKKPKVITKPIYKLIRSVRVLRPESIRLEAIREWTAPNYSYLVRGHWRRFDDPSKTGRDETGQVVNGKTWVRGYTKYEDKDEAFSAERRTADPRVTIGVKQTLASARDMILAHNQEPSSARREIQAESPTDEWMANERSKLTAGLRYIILKKDGFRCVRCGRSAVDDNHVKLEVDHKLPVSKWGLTVEDNLETLCRECNRGKSHRH